MGNYEELKQSISGVIKTNGNQEITGDIMQNTLLTIISSMGNKATFAGIATPETIPGTPDQNIFYIASKKGEYVNFDGLTIDNEVAVFTNNDGSWKSYKTGIPIYENTENTTSLIERTTDLELIDVNYNLGYINYSNGEITPTSASGDYIYSDYIEVVEGEVYVIYTKIGNGTIIEIAGYYNDTYVKDAINYPKNLLVENENIIKIPTGINKIRICSIKKVKYGAFRLKKEKNRISNLIKDIEDNKEKININTEKTNSLEKISSNNNESIVNINKELGRVQIMVNWNAGLLKTDGTTIPSSMYYYSDFIKVNAGDIYEIGLSTGSSISKGLAGYYNNEENTFVNSAFSDIVITDGKIQRVKIVIPEGINCIRIGRNGAYTGDYTAYLVNDKTLKEDVNSIKTSLSLLDNEAIKVDDLTTEIGNNLANPSNIQIGKLIDTNGNQYNKEGWALITIPVKEGDTISAGYFDLGRNGYGSFWDNNGAKIEGSNFNYLSKLSGKVFTQIAPINAVELRFDIQSPLIEVPSYENLMVNYGENILPYEPYSKTITKIKNIPLSGSGSNENVFYENIIIDLPVSDGNDIQLGFAYIESVTGNVKVKL